MTPRPVNPEELLSALHDGELSPTERAAAESLLSESPALRETLEDFGELSKVLGSLPRTAAPPQLQVEVLRQVRAAGAPTAPRPGSQASPWMWRVALLATAAVLVVMVQMRRPAGESVEVAQDMSAGEAALAATDRDAGLPLSNEVITREEQGRRDGEFSPVDATPGPHTSPRIARLTMGDEQIDASSTLADRLKLDPYSPPNATDVLAYVDRVGDQTVIVEFDVVDVEGTAEDMLVLLQRRGVTVVGARDEAKETSAGSSFQARPQDESAPLVALFVEASEAQLAGVLDDMLSEVSITESNSYNADAAGPLVTDRLQRIGERYGERSEADVADSRSSESGLPRSRTRESRLPRPTAEPLPAELATPAASSAPATMAGASPPLRLEAAPEAVGQGVRLKLPGEVYRSLEARVDVAELRRSDLPQAPEPAESGAAAPAAAGEKPSSDVEENASPAAVRRVLFVLHAAMAD